jgi:hypothetical protein
MGPTLAETLGHFAKRMPLPSLMVANTVLPVARAAGERETYRKYRVSQWRRHTHQCKTCNKINTFKALTLMQFTQSLPILTTIT